MKNKNAIKNSQKVQQIIISYFAQKFITQENGGWHLIITAYYESDYNNAERKAPPTMQ